MIKIDKAINLFAIIILIMILLFNSSTFPVLIALLIILLTIIAIKKFNISDKVFISIIILVTLITHSICIFKIKNPQISDFKTILDISQDLLDGNLSKVSQNYIDTWPYQTPFILYETILLKICNSDVFLKIINTIINVFIVLLMYNIAKKISNKKSAQIVTVLYMLFINKILYSNILTNQFPSMLFLLLGLNMFFSSRIKNEKIRILLFSICTAISNLFRPEGIIILLSFIAYEIYKLIKEKKYLNIIINILIFIMIYMLICNGTMLLLKKTIIKEPKDIGMLYKLVLGLNIDSNGQWSEEVFNKLFSFDNGNDLISYEKEQIKKNISDTRIFKLFTTKINIFWNNTDMPWTLHYLQDYTLPFEMTYSELYNTLYCYDLTIWSFIILLAIIGIKEYNKKSVIINIIIIANFTVYLLIEVQGRYASFARILLFILAAKGLKHIQDYLKKYLDSKNIL